MSSVTLVLVRCRIVDAHPLLQPEFPKYITSGRKDCIIFSSLTFLDRVLRTFLICAGASLRSRPFAWQHDKWCGYLLPPPSTSLLTWRAAFSGANDSREESHLSRYQTGQLLNWSSCNQGSQWLVCPRGAPSDLLTCVSMHSYSRGGFWYG